MISYESIIAGQVTPDQTRKEFANFIGATWVKSSREVLTIIKKLLAVIDRAEQTLQKSISSKDYFTAQCDILLHSLGVVLILSIGKTVNPQRFIDKNDVAGRTLGILQLHSNKCLALIKDQKAYEEARFYDEILEYALFSLHLYHYSKLMAIQLNDRRAQLMGVRRFAFQAE